jgi:hypothetical protein
MQNLFAIKLTLGDNGRGWDCGYRKRFAMENLRHNSKAIHRVHINAPQKNINFKTNLKLWQK